MWNLILDYASLIALLLFTLDNIFQAIHVYKRKSSADINIKGFLLRFFAAFVLVAKYYSINELFLEIGQTIYVVFLTIYLILIIIYRKK